MRRFALNIAKKAFRCRALPRHAGIFTRIAPPCPLAGLRRKGEGKRRGTEREGKEGKRAENEGRGKEGRGKAILLISDFLATPMLVTQLSPV